MNKPSKSILVIFGASGDLTKRKLMPALFDLFRQDLLPKPFAILGVGRTDYQDESFREQMVKDVKEFCEKSPVENKILGEFLKSTFYQSIDTKKSDDYKKLKDKIEKIDHQLDIGGNYIYYLAYFLLSLIDFIIYVHPRNCHGITIRNFNNNLGNFINISKSLIKANGRGEIRKNIWKGLVFMIENINGKIHVREIVFQFLL